MNFIKWLKTIFVPVTKETATVSPKPVEIPHPAPVVIDGTPTIEHIQEVMAGEFKKVSGHKEKGKNTDGGGTIDTIIFGAGGKPGDAWCALTVTYITKQTCKALGIGYPKGLYSGSSSQAFMNHSDSKYVSQAPQKLWCAFVHTDIPLNGHGHIGFKISEAGSDGTFKTAEGNFGDKIDYFIKQKTYVNKFVDIPQAILDQYKTEKKA